LSVDWQRNLLGAAIVAVFAVLFVRWNEFQEVRRPSPATTAAEILVPDVPGKVADSGIDQPGATAGDDRLISVETDVLRLVIDARGGDIVRAELLRYPVSQAPGAAPFLMLNRHGLDILIHPESGLGHAGDHAVRCAWLGDKLPLDIAFLERIDAGELPA